MTKMVVMQFSVNFSNEWEISHDRFVKIAKQQWDQVVQMMSNGHGIHAQMWFPDNGSLFRIEGQSLPIDDIELDFGDGKIMTKSAVFMDWVRVFVSRMLECDGLKSVEALLVFNVASSFSHYTLQWGEERD